ncbi:MAG: SpoIID/LytB domain-containing protein, partial [Halobacteriovoraceae bacterium]|nr:SpoIID/LytB domain-containing protein [Halobacteriovoraceae bacterium]
MKVILGLILFMCLVVVNAQAAKSPKLKVRIAKSLSKVKVSGMDLKRYIWPKKSFKSYQGAKRIHFNCRSKKLRSSKKPIRLASINSPTGMIKWDNERYKGVLHIQTSEKFDGCDIINELSLEDYLSTLLPKEMNAKWPMEALKAQAV